MAAGHQTCATCVSVLGASRVIDLAALCLGFAAESSLARSVMSYGGGGISAPSEMSY